MKRANGEKPNLRHLRIIDSRTWVKYLRNRERSSMTKLGKEFLLDTREGTFTEFIISSLEKSTKPEILI